MTENETFIRCDHSTLVIRNKKLEEVKAFIATNCNLAPQGSEEWLRVRQSIIGGSELSILLGKNPFSKVEDLVASKCCLTRYAGNVATKWGNIFEELTRMVVQMLFLPDIPLSEECIYETGSLEGKIPHHRFSPDGLTVIVYKNPDGTKKPMIVLLEFKSPLSSIPSGVIPPYYLPQVLGGMCDIDMVETGLFVNATFRKCSLAQFGNNSRYNTSFHISDIKKKVVMRDPLAIGILGFYQTPEQQTKLQNRLKYESDVYVMEDYSSDEDTREDVNIETIIYKLFNGYKKVNEIGILDIGELNDADTLTVFEYVASKYISIKYFPPNIYMNRVSPNLPNDMVHRSSDFISYKKYESDPKKFIKKFKEGCIQKNYIPVGFLPWKMMLADFLTVEKDDLYIYKFPPLIEPVIKIVEDICQTNDMNERLQRFNQYYPPRH